MNAHALEGTTYEPVLTEYTERDVALYAVAVGAGREPSEMGDIYEGSPAFAPLPTFPVILAFPGVLEMGIPEGSTLDDVLHAEQRLVLHDDIPPAGSSSAVVTVEGAWDKGQSAIFDLVAEIRVDGRLAATASYVQYVRGAGGWGGARGRGLQAAFPDAAPTATLDFQTASDQAAIYRLTGDLNPLHVDPVAASRAGLKRPILHGLCTYGIAARLAGSVLDPALARRTIDARFTGMVYPGETLRVETWKVAEHRAIARTTVLERDITVIDPIIIETVLP